MKIELDDKFTNADTRRVYIVTAIMDYRDLQRSRLTDVMYELKNTATGRYIMQSQDELLDPAKWQVTK